MADLLRKPLGTHGKVLDITPQSAGWRYVGFGLYHLRAGETVSEPTGDREVILVMVEGKAAITGADQDWGVFGDRMNVFEKHRRIVCTCQMAKIGPQPPRPTV
jgi:5-deoxy-glucuronate isomerase